MSIFKRNSDVQQPSAAVATETPPDASGKPSAGAAFAPAGAAGVVPPAAAPVYSTRLPENTRPEDGGESIVAEKVRIAREAQTSAQDRVRTAVRREQTLPSPAPGVQRRVVQQAPRAITRPAPDQPSDPAAYAQVGLLNLAWRWQEAGANIRAIHAYVELLERYPNTPAAATAVAHLVTLSEKLADEGQFHTALAIYDHLEELA